jgi:ADP-heptose:LPS heptosyltransferase
LSPSRLLIIRLGSLGDIIHAIPAFAAIRRAMPDATVDWLVDRRHRELIDLVPGITRRLTVETRGAGSIYTAVKALRQHRYDVALDLQGLLKSAVLARLSGASKVIGFPTPLLRERAATVFYTETAGEAAPHIIDKNLSMLKAIGLRHTEVEFPIDVAENRRGSG